MKTWMVDHYLIVQKTKKVEATAHHSQENYIDVFMNSPKVELNLKMTP